VTARGNPAPARTGRRPGNPATREAILTAARSAFAETGYAGTSLRRIAALAGVDAALIHHYFGSKDQLFLATVELPVNPGALIERMAQDGLDGLGRRLIDTLLTVWESPIGERLVAIVRTVLLDPSSARTFQEFLALEVVGRVLTTLHDRPEEAPLRSALVVSQIVGVIVGRYVVGIGPLRDAPVDELATSVGDTLQRYLTGPLPEATAIRPIGPPQP
jgi:AcrR family transcriptional regulator